MSKRKPNLKLKALRVEYSLTQADIAKILGIGETTYNRKENGLSQFTENEIKKICEIFDREPTDIFFKDKVTKAITNITDEQAATSETA